MPMVIVPALPPEMYKRAVLQVITQYGPLTRTKISQHVPGGTDKATSKILQELRREGKVYFNHYPSGWRVALYSLSSFDLKRSK